MKETAGIKRRLFFKIVAMTMPAMALTILPLEGARCGEKTAKVYGKAAIIMKSGDVKPAAKKDFVLLPFSLYGQGMKINEEAEEYLGPEPPLWQISDSKELRREKDRKRLEYAEKDDNYRRNRIMEELQKAKEQGKYIEFRTDFDGSYAVVVPPGSWYICSQYKGNQGFAISIGNASIVWSVPITVKAGQVLKLDLENDNASHIFNKQE